jgi:hypothetical protein
MRFLFVSIGIFLGLPMFASCQNAPEPRILLKKAIAAHGGEKNITKPRVGMLKGTNNKKGDLEITQEEVFDLPKQWKRVTTGAFEGQRRTSFDLMIEGKFWEWENGEQARQTENQRGAQPYFAVATVLLDLTGEKVKLSLLEKKKFNDRSAFGLRAAWDGGGADYYFDTTSELLIESSFIWRGDPGKEFESKTLFGDYKEIDGIKLPHRRSTYIKRGEAKEYVLVSDFVVTEVRILNKLPDDAFSLPKQK